MNVQIEYIVEDEGTIIDARTISTFSFIMGSVEQVLKKIGEILYNLKNPYKLVNEEKGEH